MMRYWLLLVLLLGSTTIARASGELYTAEETRWIAQQRALRVAIDPTQWNHFDINPQQGRNRSLLADYVDLVSKRSGLTFNACRTDSLQASFEALRAGQVDVMMVAAAVPDIESSGLLYSRPYYTGATLLITRRHAPPLTGLDQLEGRTLAFRGGGGYEAWLRQHYPGIKRLPLDSLPSVLAAVENDIADAAIGLDTSIRPMLRRDFSETLRQTATLRELPVDVRLVVRPEQAPLLSIIDKSVASITEIEQAEMLTRWMTATYFGAPTLAIIARHYRTELLIGLATLSMLLMSLYLMRRAQNAARRSEREKARFVAVMSHEVRNSANTISASVELLLQSALDPQQRRLLTSAHTAGESLRAMLNQALDYSRLDAKGAGNPAEPSDVAALVHECIAALQPAIAHKPVTLALANPESVLPMLLLDATSVRQLLTNLLTNAVKFTDAGRIDVELRTRQIDSRHVTLCIAVHDTGIGIPLEQQGQMFQPFSRVNAQVAQPLGGAGLGLSICHSIVEQLGGTIRFNSTAGVGTSFLVELPCAIAIAGCNATASEPSAPCATTPAQRVLLVEDHPGNRQTILDQLQFLGLQAEATEAGLPGVDAYRAGVFDVVLLDCNLPDITGYEVARRIRCVEQLDGRPPATLVAISASVEARHHTDCRQSGMNIVLTKPLPLGALRQALGMPKPPVPVSAPTPPSAELRHVFSQALGEDLEAIDHAIAQQDLARLARHAHRIRGAALIVVETAMADTAGDLCGLEIGDDDLWQEAARLRSALRSMARGQPQHINA
jgi:signal transduction histidine kinase/HPt (histidine-containing phosphotransfer) domain-containing protein